MIKVASRSFSTSGAADGEKPWRKRDEEFEVQNSSNEEVIKLWEEGWKVLLDTLSSLKEEDCQRSITIRHEQHSVVDAINRQLAHYSYHVGQIVLLAKWLKGEQWQSLSIEKNGSNAFNEKMMGGKH